MQLLSSDIGKTILLSHSFAIVINTLTTYVVVVTWLLIDSKLSISQGNTLQALFKGGINPSSWKVNRARMSND